MERSHHSRTLNRLFSWASSEWPDLPGLTGACPSYPWTGRVRYEESLRYIQEASVCLLVEGSMKEGIYLPSKVADYAVARKPLLALSPAPGVIADMVPGRGLVRVDPRDVPAIGAAFRQFYQLHQSGGLERERPPEEFVAQFTPARVADTFLRAVHEAIPALSDLRDSCTGRGRTVESAA